MKVVILAAGKGSRLKELTNSTSKPLIKINGDKKIMDYILDSLPNNTEEVYIIVKHLKEQFYDYQKKIQDRYNFKIKIIEHILEPGTFTTLLNVKKYFKTGENFLVIHGDDIHQKKEVENFIKLKWAMSVAEKKMPENYITFEIDKNEFLIKTRKQTKEELKNGCLIASGMYLLDYSIFSKDPILISGNEASLPAVLFKEKETKPVKIYKEKKWLTVNTLEDLEEVKERLENEK